jgi:hypothetical protein
MFFSAPYLFIISSPFSGMPSKPNESSISGAKVFLVFFTPPQGQALAGLAKNLPLSLPLSIPGERIYSPKPCTTKHYLF